MNISLRNDVDDGIGNKYLMFNLEIHINFNKKEKQ